MGPSPAPGRKASGAEVWHEPSHQIVSESKAVDHLDEEAV